VEEHLELVLVEETTAANKFFSQLVILLNKSEMLREKMTGFVSDGAPTTTGKNNYIAAKFKKKWNNLSKQLSLVSTVFFFKKQCLQRV
jgi:hypothetical protein